MKLRSFLKTMCGLPVVPYFPFVKPREWFCVEVFPSLPEHLPGLRVYFLDSPNFREESMEIVREWDECNDRYAGQYLANPRRNKWWVKDRHGKEQLAVINWMGPWKDRLMFTTL